MITQIRRFEDEDPQRVELIGSAQDASSTEVAEQSGAAIDAYASAELHRRLERAESMIRKAHEQFL